MSLLVDHVFQARNDLMKYVHVVCGIAVRCFMVTRMQYVISRKMGLRNLLEVISCLISKLDRVRISALEVGQTNRYCAALTCNHGLGRFIF